MLDGYGREADYLRISVTDKCNLRCRYCMPVDIETVPMSEILTFEEVTDTVSVAASLGIKKVRITGGEPLIRRNVNGLIKMLKAVDGIEQVTLTTNGVLLPEYIGKLKEAGIDVINISLDTLDREKYKELTGSDELDRVLGGIKTALKTDIPIKLNAVSLDLEDAFSLVEFVKDKALDLRFIELMPIGYGRDHRGIPHSILITSVMDRYDGAESDDTGYGNGPAVSYRIPGYKGRIGFISALSRPFCDNCNRIRLTTKGYLKSCLCYDTGVDLKGILRSGLPEDARKEKLRYGIKEAILCKPKSHCFISEDNISEKDPMSRIGG